MQFQILNGDALAQQFPEDIPGKRIIARECLVDGPVQANSLEDFFKLRSSFLKKHYDTTAADYRKGSRDQLLKIRDISEDADISLWFEDDLFCQVNLWFICHLLGNRESLYLVRPTTHVRYGFGGMDANAMRTAWQNRFKLKPAYQEIFAQLWISYQNADWNALLTSSRSLPPGFSFVTAAAEAQVDRIPGDGEPGRPERILRSIIDELDTTEFGPVFQEFHKRAAIYGFGDLQVKRLFDELQTADQD